MWWREGEQRQAWDVNRWTCTKYLRTHTHTHTQCFCLDSDLDGWVTGSSVEIKTRMVGWVSERCSGYYTRWMWRWNKNMPFSFFRWVFWGRICRSCPRPHCHLARSTLTLSGNTHLSNLYYVPYDYARLNGKCRPWFLLFSLVGKMIRNLWNVNTNVLSHQTSRISLSVARISQVPSIMENSDWKVNE